jgi:MFS family permease
MNQHLKSAPDAAGVESVYAWARLIATLVFGTIAGVGMWSVVVTLPIVQAEFGVDRGTASLPYTMTLLAVATGSVMMGALADRFGVIYPAIGGAIAIGLGYLISSQVTNFWLFVALHGLVIGFLGGSISFAPLIADVSHWFNRRRGIAVAICASGSYLAGTIWPPVVQHFVDTVGWRQTYVGIGIFCLVTLLPLTLAFRRTVERQQMSQAAMDAAGAQAKLGISPNVLLALLVVAGVACCVAMSMPQVHIVAYCGDLGYGAARGAEMLSLMLGFGIVSRLASGWIADKIGGLATVLLGSVLQTVALMLYVPFDSLPSLYVIAILFGLFQGGIVPSYAIVIREFFPPQQAGSRIGIVLMSTMLGMALGGWLTGAIYDLTGSYTAAFVNGIAWNILNAVIILWLLIRKRQLQTVVA